MIFYLDDLQSSHIMEVQILLPEILTRSISMYCMPPLNESDNYYIWLLEVTLVFASHSA